jgi:hypothetical protein
MLMPSNPIVALRVPLWPVLHSWLEIPSSGELAGSSATPAATSNIVLGSTFQTPVGGGLL